MNEREAEQILRKHQIEVGLDDPRPLVEIIRDPRLGLGEIAAGAQLEFLGIEDSGTYSQEDAAREGLVIEPHAFGQRVYRQLEK